ncbi:apolipoprotein N-acyltransferase [Dechloromonas sp.]|uniref:apolipoprotein N-acyltransferase n=1 Tax=Dechloromonas sp. TaxID=1917218 RepID=UPI0012157BC1|nr:apolipoprotein N-acyltransferase [Dechloromonas sp.]MBU3697287.1 apolipoprotein N-acyltransferase [Dechloromonas sp.]TEX44418.1 MAG: apolipoprotein N-acyltransferase [Rhodocyclaceae bacterium]
MPTLGLPERQAVRLALAALLGVAGVGCFAPFELFWVAPLIWAGLFGLLCRSSSVREASLTGLAFGLGFFLTGVSWVYVSLSVFGGMPWWLAGIAAFLFCAVMALFPTAASAAFKRWQPVALWQQALFFAALIALADWIRGWIFSGFPWLTVGYSQSPPSPLAGFAPLLGVHGLSLLVALSGALLWRWRIGLPVLLALVATGFGFRQIAWTLPDGEPVSVALIQGNVPQEMKFRPEAFVRTLQLYRDLIAANPAQLTLLPETALPVFIDQMPTAYLEELKTLAQRQQGDIILGVLTGDGGGYFNSAVSIGSSPLQVYSKQHLVPYGEFIPPGFAWFMAYANIPMSSFSRGPDVQAPLAVAGRQVAANICYEDVFGDEIIRALPAAGILANLSNTAWFGRSLAQPQHLQIARLRAAETGRPMLRATNTGMTAIVDSRGGVSAVLPPFTTGVLTGEVRAYTGMTPYARFGNWPALVIIFATLAIAFRSSWRTETPA